MVKVISLSEEAYKTLKTIKGNNSFSELVVELVNERPKKKSIKEFFGVFKENTDEWEKINKKLYEDRKKFKLREVKL